MDDQAALERTNQIITQLRAMGRAEQAWELHRAIVDKIGAALMLALREACDTIMTMMEAIEPETETALEELRADVDAWLTPARPPHTHT